VSQPLPSGRNANQIRELRGRASCGLSHGDGSGPDGHPWWPCARETHGCACGVLCSAGRCASCSTGSSKKAGKAKPAGARVSTRHLSLQPPRPKV
jgi:hypothetical protein